MPTHRYHNAALLDLRLATAFQEVADGNLGATPSIDWNQGIYHRGTLTANATPTFVDPPGILTVQLILEQGGVGSFTVTWPASVLWPDNGTPPTLSTAVGALDMFSFYFDGTNYWGNYRLDYA